MNPLEHCTYLALNIWFVLLLKINFFKPGCEVRPLLAVINNNGWKFDGC